MHELIGFSITVFFGFFAIMNPLANVPIFLSLTTGMDKKESQSVALKTALFSFGIIVVFVFAGSLIFEAFGITLPAFRIAGGILVALIGYNLLHGEVSKVHSPEANEPVSKITTNLALCPLAMPILAGPGTIATAMGFVAHGDRVHLLIVVLVSALMSLLCFLAFSSGPWIVEKLGTNAIKVISRLMGLILCVIGVQMFVDGVGGAVRHFLATLH